MKIIKNCFSKFNIATTKTIQIGTISYYRKTDNKFIADPQEGFGSHLFHSESSKIVIQEKDTTALAQGRIVGARIAIDPGGKFTGTLWSPNVYIFCCSMVDVGTKDLTASLGYNSFYEIVDPNLFMHRVKEGFTDAVRLRDSNPRVVNTMHIHGPVRYQGDREHSHSEPCSLSDLMVLNLFTKPTFSPADQVNYEENQEYRFVWVFLEENTKKILEVEDDPILVRNVQAIRQACRY